MTLVASWRRVRYQHEIEARRRAQDPEIADEAARGIQLRRLNTEWARLLETSPYFARMQRERGLPRQFEALDQFTKSVPPTTRIEIQTHGEEMRSRGRGPEFFRTTGGSTAQPVQLPAWTSEIAETRPDTWLGRSWYGVTPASRLFMLWGHSHLMGDGLRGRINFWKRRLSDHALGYTRVSAYDLRVEKLRAASKLLMNRQPDYIVGYSVALDLFARANEDQGAALRSLRLKTVVGTSEGFPSEDAPRRLEALFACPVAMEYGSVETGVMAHTHPSGGFVVFWNSYFLDAEPSGAGHRLYVTSLYPRCFPLVRYDIGDEVVVPREMDSTPLGLRRLERVLGRCNDYVTLTDGAVAHSELFTHAVRPCAEMHGYQIVQRPSLITIRYVAPRPLSEDAMVRIRERLATIHPSLRAATFERVERLEQTVAGKTRMIVRE